MARLSVRLTPRGGRDAVEGWARDAAGRPVLKVRVAAAPTDGKANAALVALIAETVGRPKSAVRIAAGATGRLKQVEIDGLSETDLGRQLGLGGG